ncbi:MAG: AtpZ/AtpI family protein [Proteobacteria bacterium]|nr:AtpZ/AtpI family protein [Pseudomonadota bacterium]MBI3498299.1 AtpZ/AtpI family protein [Pseudomonadota bacterium]
MPEPKHPLSLDELEKRLAAVRGRDDNREGVGERSGGSMSQALGLAFRAGVELVAAFVVALGIGWLIDSWLGTKPWFLLVFFFLGTATAFMNVMRVVKGMGLAVGFPGAKGKGPEDDASSEDKRG